MTMRLVQPGFLSGIAVGIVVAGIAFGVVAVQGAQPAQGGQAAQQGQPAQATPEAGRG